MRFGKKVFPLSVLALIILALSVNAVACTSIPMGKLATVDGSVMTAHTCDGWYDARTFVVEGGVHEAGETVPVYYNMLHADRTEPSILAEIPQVPVTYNYFYAGYPYMNDQGVIMGETTLGNRRELRGAEGIFYIEALQALGLARAKTAREAIQIMGELAETYGYVDSGECLTVGDQNEIWFFEIMPPGPLNTGAIWAAVRIPDDHASVSANRSRIGTIKTDDPDNYMYSDNVFQVAIDNGWWDPNSGEEFLFYNAYAASTSAGSRLREWRSLSWAAPSLNLDPNEMRYPFSVKVEGKRSVADYMAIYRDHYEGTEFDKANSASWYLSNGNRSVFATPNSGSDMMNLLGITTRRNISIPGCSYFTILQSRSWLDPKIGTLAWYGFNNTDTSVYVPIYAGVTHLPESYAINDRSTFDFDNYGVSAWWAFDLCDNLVNRRYQEAILDVRAVQAAFEAESFAFQPAIEAAASELMKTNPEQAIWLITNFTNSRANEAVATWWDLNGLLITKYDDKGF